MILANPSERVPRDSDPVRSAPLAANRPAGKEASSSFGIPDVDWEWKDLAPSNACLVLQSGQVLYGTGHGSPGIVAGEICFNTSITGYQEVLTDPSYAGQIVVFTNPHVGNVGTNPFDEEGPGGQGAAIGAILRNRPTRPSNWRSQTDFEIWLCQSQRTAISGIDTRALTTLLREKGALSGLIAYHPDRQFDVEDLQQRARDLAPLLGSELATGVSTPEVYAWTDGDWRWPESFSSACTDPSSPRVVVMDFGVKRAILRQLVDAGCAVSVVPSQMSAQAILSMKPKGVVLSNGPGDPAATDRKVGGTIRALIAAGIPLLGICLGHQLLALALGARTQKMVHGHHGANHPVLDRTAGTVGITSMNHGFAVDEATLPATARTTHVSLFDGSNCGFDVAEQSIFAVQFHPEASPGPCEGHAMFARFRRALDGGA